MKRHNESLKKLFIATSKDIRVAIIKFADRLHNMQTLEHVKPEKRLRIATETLDIYAPLAYRLGITTFSKQLEDLAFPYVYPEAYKKTNEILSVRKKQTINRLEKIIKSIKRKLAENDILDFISTYRIKGIYSLYKKLKRKK
jgi:GTP pyrophosphokinase